MPVPVLRLDLVVGNVAQAVAGLRSVAAAQMGVAQGQQQITQSLTQSTRAATQAAQAASLVNNSPGGAAVGGPPGGVAGGNPTPGPAGSGASGGGSGGGPSRPRGYFARVQAAQQNLAQLNMQGGTPDEILEAQLEAINAQRALSNAQQRVQDANGGDIQSRLLNMLGSARLTRTGLHFRGVSLNRLASVFQGGKMGLGGMVGGGGGVGGVGGVGGAALGSNAINLGAPGAVGGIGAVGNMLGRGAAGVASVGGAAGMGMRLLGVVSKFLGPIGIAIGAISFLGDMARQAAEHLNEIRSAQLTTGGTTGNISLLQSMGIGPGQVGNLAAEFRQRLANDPQAMFAGGRVGVGPQMDRRYGGALNEAEMLQGFIKGVANLATAEERLNTLRMAGMDSLMGAVETYRLHAQQINQDANLQVAISDPESQKAAEELQYQAGRVAQSWSMVAASLGKPFMGLAAKILEGFANTLQTVARVLNHLTPILSFVSNSIAFVFDLLLKGVSILVRPIGFLFNMVGRFMDTLMNPTHFDKNRKDTEEELKSMFKDPAAWGNENSDALKENTQALQENTGMMKAGFHGGGDRMRGVLPENLRGEALNKMLDSQRVFIGAMRL